MVNKIFIIIIILFLILFKLKLLIIEQAKLVLNYTSPTNHSSNMDNNTNVNIFISFSTLKKKL